MYTAREFTKILSDIKKECTEFAQMKAIFIIKPLNSVIGAEVGSIFVETENEEDSLKILEGMKGKTYQGRVFNMICIPEMTYQQHFARLNV